MKHPITHIGRLVSLFVAIAALCASPLPSFALSDPYLEESPSAIVCDQTGRVLWSRNADDELPMASITKVMTAMVALDSGYDLDTPCTITELQWTEGAQLVGYVATDTPTMRELLQATLVYSGNDAASNVGINVAGSEAAFVGLMNQKAQQLGLTHTHFANPHGLEAEGHYASVADLVVMGRYAMEHYPFIAETVHKRGVEATVDGYEVWLESTDDLMETYEGLLGIKTGMVEAGATFLGASQRGTVTLYTAVLGCDTGEGRFADTARLMDWGYDSFAKRTFGRSGWVLRTSPYALGFGARCLVRVTDDQVATTWPEGGGTTYRSVTTAPDVLLEPSDAFSAIWWRQDGRLAGASTVQVGSLVTDVPSVNAFALPLFMEQDAS